MPGKVVEGDLFEDPMSADHDVALVANVSTSSKAERNLVLLRLTRQCVPERAPATRESGRTRPTPFGDLKIVLKMAPIFSLDRATGNMRAKLFTQQHVYLHQLTFAKAKPELRREEDPRFEDFSRRSC